MQYLYKLIRLLSSTVDSCEMLAFWCELEYNTFVTISHIHHTLGVYSYATLFSK